MKKMMALMLLIATLAGMLMSCQKTDVIIGSRPSPGSSSEESLNSDWTLPSPMTAPDPTPAKDPASGIVMQYTCSPIEGGTIQGTGTQYIKKNGYTELITAIPLYGYRFTGWSDGYQGRTRVADVAKEDTVFTAYFEPVEVPMKITVPDFYLNTDTGRSIKSKTYVSGSLTVTGAEKEKYDLTGVTLQVKGRGNSNWSTSYIDRNVGDRRWTTTKKKYEIVDQAEVYSSKNSYTIKFSESTNLLGIGNGKNRDWILQSNKYDPSMLRNVFMWTLATKMGTLSWCSHFAWVNLYVNGEYRGLYMLVEKVEACKDRVQLDDTGTDPDKGYLVELDFRVDKDSTKKEGLDYFVVPEFHKNDSNRREFDILSEHSTEAECNFIRDYFIEVDAAIRSHDKERIEQLVDLYSMVDIFIIEELGKDCDWGATSFYMYKEKGGKLYFCSPWDFDFCFGVYSSALTEKGLISSGTSGNEWFEQLHDQAWFIEMVRARLNGLEDALQESLVVMQKYALALAPYVEKNEEKWHIFGLWYHYFVSKEVSELIYSYEDHVAFIHEWILYRWTELRRYYPEKELSSTPLKL